MSVLDLQKMSQITTIDTLLSQIGERLSVWLEEARDALSDHTVRALRADLKLFVAWCGGRRLTPLPARPETVAAYVDAMAGMRAPATVRRYVASIAAAHRGTGERNPVEHPEVHQALRRMRRRHGSRQQQVKGLTWTLRRRLVEAAGDRLIDLRNRALLAVAYDAMLRRSELVTVRVADMSIDARGSASLFVRRAKNDPEGSGATLYLHRDTVALVREWLAAGGITSGRLFRSVRRSGDLGEALDPSQVPRIYRAMARRAGLSARVVRRISGHSPRVGAAQDMIASGIGIPAIMQAGRWKSASMVQRYGERLLASRNAAAQLARLQKRGLAE